MSSAYCMQSRGNTSTAVRGLTVHCILLLIYLPPGHIHYVPREYGFGVRNHLYLSLFTTIDTMVASFEALSPTFDMTETGV